MIKRLPGKPLLKALFIIPLLVFFVFINFAGTEHNSGVGTVSNQHIPGSSVSWSNTPGAQVPGDGSQASIATPLASIGDYTDYLVVTNFNFSIPAGVVIEGITVNVNRNSSNPSGTKDYSVKIIKNGALTGNDLSVSSSWASSPSSQVYGGASNLWGTTWDSDAINSADFGIAVSFKKSGGASAITTYIDDISIKVTYSSMTLPVKLTSFTARQKDNKIQLEWTTASEINNDYFTVERTENGVTFEEVATVKGTGNSSSPHIYSAYDHHPIFGNAYYRLKQTDYDGKFEEFDMISVAVDVNTSKCKFKILPNPCRGHCNVMITECDSKDVSVALIDALGNEVYSRVPITGDNTFSIDTENNLKPGIYIVMGSSKDQAFNERVVVQ